MRLHLMGLNESTPGRIVKLAFHLEYGTYPGLSSHFSNTQINVSAKGDQRYAK